MPISENTKAHNQPFEGLLHQAHIKLEQEAKLNPNYFLGRSATEFEDDVCQALEEAALGTVFQGAIEKIGGHKFPDIVVNKVYGVEVKTTKQDHWKTTGNSVLESTRIDGVEIIYLYFAKLMAPISLRYRRYQDCLSDIAVTHSPRYQIDMDLGRGETIFDKMGLPYEEMRNLANPIEPFVQYYRGQTKPGEEPWWMGEEAAISPMVRFFDALPAGERQALKAKAMILFPEVYGTSTGKYKRLTLWLVTRHGLVISNVRDLFSAGGKKAIALEPGRSETVHKVFYFLAKDAQTILETFDQLEDEEFEYYWGDWARMGERIDIWKQMVMNQCMDYFPSITELFSTYY